MGPDRKHLTLHALDRERQAAPLGVDLEDLDPDLVARLDQLAWAFNMVLGEL